MLTPFPDLLTYSFFAPTLLRVAVAATLAYVAYLEYKHRRAAHDYRYPVWGHAPWAPTFAVIVYTALAAMLLAGYYTQIAAVLAGLGALKGAVLAKRYPAVFPLSRTAFILVTIVCLSLMFTGAGALAFDLPL